MPTTLVVLASVTLEHKILAMPKSEILGFMSRSRRMLLALRSRWMNGREHSSCS